MPLCRGVETDNALSYNDTLNLYLLKFHQLSCCFPLGSGCSAIFNNFGKAHCLLASCFSTPSLFVSHVHADILALLHWRWLCWTWAKVSIQSVHICDSLLQALGSHCNLQNVALCPRQAGKMALFLLHLAHWKRKKPKVYSPGRCNCRRDKRKIKLKGEATLCSVICIDLSFQPHFNPYAHNFRSIHNRFHSLVCCALGM